MKKLFVALIVLVLSVVTALWLHEQGGLVIVSVGDLTIQTSLILFVGMLVAAWMLVSLGVALLRRVLGVPARVRSWRRSRGRRLAHRELLEGLLRLVEGREADAQRTVLQHLDGSDLPLLHLIAAAVAAQRQGQYEERDRLLTRAHEQSARTRPLVGVAQAELQVEAGQWEQALATLTYLHEQAPHNPRVVRMLLQVIIKLEDWGWLERVLPELRRRGVQDEATALMLEQVLLARFPVETARADAERLWNALPKAVRERPAVVVAYAGALQRLEASAAAEELLRMRLQKRWDTQLLRAYGELDSASPERLLVQLEKWLRERPDDADLLYAAGRQGLKARIWGRARDYLEAAAERGVGAEAYYSLGALLERMQQTEGAEICYRKALESVLEIEPLPVLSEGELVSLAAHGEELAKRQS